MKFLRCFAVVLLVAGGALTCRAGYQQAKGRLAGVLIRRAWQSTLRSGSVRAPWPGADLRPIARLTIPRLGYDQIVLEGATPRTLAFGPTHMLNGARFGEHGNLLLAGHRDSWFLSLGNIAEGDEIEVTWFDLRTRSLNQRRYQVNFIQVTGPQEMTLLAPTADDVLTLVTCYPFGHSRTSPQRFLVRATPTA